MSSVIFLADDKSPLIHYDSGWAPGTSGSDSLFDQYFRGTYQKSNVTGSIVTFSFNGTAFWIYGAQKPNHATRFTITVDNQSYSNINGESSTNLFQQVLFNQSGLAQGMHTVSLTNTGSSSGTSDYIDIDMVTWQSDINAEQLVLQTIDDTDSAFQYQEPPAWSTNPTNVNLFSDGTAHSTSTYGANVTLTFTVSNDNQTLSIFIPMDVSRASESVSIFGSVGPNSGPYSVSLDSKNATTYNATTYLTFYQVMLYHADNLGPGQHQLTLTNLLDSDGQALSIDYAELLTPSSSSPTSGGTSNIDAASTGLGSGAIAGIAVVSTTALLAYITAFVFYRRWRFTQAASHDMYRIHTFELPPVTGASFSAEARSNANPVRNGLSSPTTYWRAYQQRNHKAAQRGAQGRRTEDGEPHMPIVDGVMNLPVRTLIEESANTRRPLPDAPGTEQNIFQQPVLEESQVILIEASPAQRHASIQSSFAATSDVPPDYVQATR